MAHKRNIWIYLCGLFCLSVLECVIQSEGPDSINTACANEQHAVSCGNNTEIAVTGFAYGYKGISLNCTNATGSCCTYNSTTDCFEVAPNDAMVMGRLSGRSDGIAETADAVSNTTCILGGYTSISTLSRISYQCIPGSRIKEMCVKSSYRSQDGLAVYVQNRDYRSGTSILATDTSCSVSVEILTRSTNTQLYTLHMQLSGTSTSCQKSITVSNGSDVVKTFGCIPAPFNEIQTETLTGNYFLFNLTNTNAASGGKFWIGVEGASESPPIVMFSPAVSRINCGALSNPVNGDVFTTDTHYGSVANYTCISGYEVVSGNISRICQENETWSGTAVVCSYNCGNLTGPQNGFVTFTGTYPGHTATYGCDKDYVIEGGNMHRSCIDGSGWNGTLLQCIYECGLLNIPQNGRVSYNATTAGSMATYICNSGFELNGTQTRNCVSGTGWNGSEPMCYAILVTQPPNADCPELRSNSNIFVTTNGTSYNSVATYTCPVMYSPTGGNVTRVCQGDGTWSGSEPFCQIDLVMWIIIGVVAAVFLVIITGIAYKVTANRRQQSKRHENQGDHHPNDNDLVNQTSRHTSDINGDTDMSQFSLPRYIPDVSSGEYSGHMENIDKDENKAIIEKIDDIYTHHHQDREDREVACTRM